MKMLLEPTMSEQDPMDINERRKYIHKMWGRYREAGRVEKGKLLDEMGQVTGMHRKTLIRLLNGQLSRKKRSRQRGRVYGVEVDDAIRVIARSLDYPCSERLQPNLAWMADHLKTHQELVIRPETRALLDKVSVSTLKRILKRVGRSQPKLAYRQPRRPQSNTLRKQYPMNRIAWDVEEAGSFEVDLVHHCGEIANGEYIHTLQMVDVTSGWSEITAIYGRSSRVMQNGFDFLLKRLPFPVRELHPDNGAEFFNHPMIRFWKQRLPNIEISRSRPYQKNDNRFVEENNASLIRAYVGHGRFDTQLHLAILRTLYDKLWLYHNFFLPVLRLQSKQFISPMKYRRQFDQARPPFGRLKELHALPPAVLPVLEALRANNSPLRLRDEIGQLIDELLNLPVLGRSETVNVFETLLKEVDSSVTLSFEPTMSVR
jgi:hypothetical protein